MPKTLQEELDALEAEAKLKKGDKEPVTFNVPRHLMNSYRAICARKGLKHSQLVVAFIASYVRENETKPLSYVPRLLTEEGEE